jgi:hypothetical protein
MMIDNIISKEELKKVNMLIVGLIRYIKVLKEY